MADPKKPELSVTLDATDDGLTATVNSAEKEVQGLGKKLDETAQAAERMAASTDKASTAAAGSAAAAARAAAATSTAAAEQAAAQTAVSASAAAGANSMGLLTRAGSVLFAAMGGWIGVATLAAGALVYLAARQSDAEKSAAALTEVTDKLNAAHERTAAGAAAAVAAKQREVQASLDHAKAMKAELEAQMAMDQPAEFYQTAAAQLDHYTGVIKVATDALQKFGLASKQAAEDQQLAKYNALSASLDSQVDQLKMQIATYGQGAAAIAEYNRQQEIAKLGAQADTEAGRQQIQVIDLKYQRVIALSRGLDALKNSTKANTESVRDAAAAEREHEQAIKAIAQAYAGIENLHEQLLGSLDPVTKAWQDSAKAIRTAADYGATLIKNGVDEASVQALVASRIDDATAARNRDLQAAQRQMDVSGRLIDQIEQEARIATLSDRDQAIARAGMQAEQEIRSRNLQLTQDQIAAERQRVEAAAAGAYDMQMLADQQRAIAQEYSGYWENAAGSVARKLGDVTVSGLRDWRGFGQSMKSIAQQFVSDIIAQFLRLQVIGPLMSGAMQSVAGWLGISGSLGGSTLVQAAQYVGGGAQIGTQAGSTGGTASGGNSLSGYLSNLSTAKSAYSYLFGGSAAATPSALAGSGTSYLGTGSTSLGAYGGQSAGGFSLTGGTYTGAGSTSLGAYGGNVTYAPYGGTWGIGGYSAPVASYGGALAGAYYGSQQGSGGLSTVASTVSYGALGAGIAGTAAGVAGGASVGAAAGSAFGATAAASSWIPVVGWVLAAMAVVDAVSGGKLFGTKFRATQGNTVLDLSAAGGNATQSITEKRQGALFSGAKWRTKVVEASAEAQKAADELYNKISKSMVQGAQQLGTTVPEMINAQLQIQTNYNDKGQVRSTQYLVNYLGRTWKEATADAAAQRIGAEAIIATVAASAGKVAQTIAEQWRASAQTLADGAAFLLAAQTDIVKGNSLVALGASATLAQVTAFTQQMQADGETLAQTYQRLAQASAQYLQFVGQFQPQTQTFGGALEAINQQMLANINQANALAQAAGLQGAREQDLANIHQYAAQQAAAAIAQLDSAAQDLVSKLYGVTQGSLAAITGQLDAMKAKVQASTQTAIGDLSPLNDKQKLDLALKGLRSGITSADDVLSLGRKLYASSSDYTGLYNQVMSIVGGTGAGDTSASLDQYNQLAAQQATLQAQAQATQRFNDAKTLAQYVADLSQVHGVSYTEAASGLGLNLQSLAQDLGLTNLAGYLDTLKAQDIPGTTMTAASSIVDAIRGIGSDIVSAILKAPIVQPGATTATGGAGSDAQQQALLAKLDTIIQQQNQIITHTGDTADTNKDLLTSAKRDILRGTLGTSRTGAVV